MCLFLNHLNHWCVVYSYDVSDISFTWRLSFWFSQRLGDVHLSIVRRNRVLTAQCDEDWNKIKPHRMGFHSITGWVMSFQQHSYSYTQAEPWTNAGHTTNEAGFHPAVMCHLLGCQGLLMTTFHDVWRFKRSTWPDLTPLCFSIQSDIRVHDDRNFINANWICISSMWWTQPS